MCIHFLRIGGAFFAGFASLGWIAEQLLDVHIPIDAVVGAVANRAVWIAGSLFPISLGCSLHDVLDQKATTTALR